MSRERLTGATFLFDDITAWKAADDALRASEERFRRVVMGAPHPVILYADDGEVLLINETWSAITGYQREDIPNIDTWVEKAHGDRKHTVLGQYKPALRYGGSGKWG